MDIIRSITSSFRALNRMGNEQSSQRVPESSAEAPSAKNFNPDDVTDSDDEKPITKQETSPSAPESELQSTIAQNSQINERRDKMRKKRRISKSRSVSDFEKDVASHSEHGAEDVDQHQESSERDRPDMATKANTEEGLSEDNAVDHKSNSDPEAAYFPNKTQLEHQSSNGRSDEAGNTSSPLQIRSKMTTTRYPCPLGNRYDCNKTFTSESGAKRHAELHLPREPVVCPVCAKSYSRRDKLKKHMLTHTREEVNNAAAMQHSPRPSQEAIDHSEVAVQTEGIDEEVWNEDNQIGPDVHDCLQETSRNGISTLQQDPVQESIHDRSSANPSNSSLSMFDGIEDTGLVQETPRPKTRLKRKRDVQNSGRLSEFLTEASRKRRRRHSLSPPTSIASDDEVSRNGIPGQANEPTSTSIPKVIKQLQSTRMGNLDDFAKPWTPGSQLHHPIHNPRSPRVGTNHRFEILVPQTSKAGPSARARLQHQRNSSAQTSDRLGSEQTPLAGKSQRVVLTSPKGKSKADNGVTYSSPPRQANDIVEKEEDSDEREHTGMATSVARRGAPSVAGQKRPRQPDDEEEEVVHTGASSQARQKGVEKPFRCQECGRKFATKESLQKHEKRPNVHSATHVCEDCSKTFSSLEKLRTHQQTIDHGDGTGEQGKKGAFTPREISKLQQWRDNFCEENDINLPTFNQMMTDTCRRTKTFTWPYRFITKSDFMKEYFDVLPDRNRRSMLRYREREFQNVPGKQEWTEEDDVQLMQLVEDIGPKWVEIGQLMTRTQDSVNQRWRFKLKYQGKAHQGEWIKSEEDKLKDAVAQVKRESGLPLDVNADVRIPWDSVSKKMKGKRTPQQCSNKWRLMHLTRRGNIFFKPSDSGQRLSTSHQVITPSKMSLRLAGQTPSSSQKAPSSKKRIVSEKHVHESDDENNLSIGEGDNFQPTSSQIGQKYDDDNDRDDDDDSDSTSLPRSNPLASETPLGEKGLSQAFAQTQANTSALRAPNTTRKPHTQTEMPTPGVLIQHRPVSSPWQAINTTGNTQISQDQIMAEPHSSDAESSSARSVASSASKPESSEPTSSEESEDEEVEAETASQSSTTESSDARSNQSSDSEGVESDEDADARDVQKDFVRQLQPPLHNSFPSSQPGRFPIPKKRSGRIDFAGVYRGDAAATQDESDSDDESADEGDIMHH